MNSRARVENLLSEMTPAEKADLITGAGIWTSRPITRLGVGTLTVTDGPNGARGGGLFGTGTPTACIPAGSVLGATWDTELLDELGKLLGEESIAKGANVLLAPTINLHRNPLGGRNFECYSEDPLLTGRLAASFIGGVQSQGVGTTPKHFVGNDSEFERNTIDVQADERTLREVYLLPFEMAVKDGGAWGLMSAYNRLNGSFCSENSWLLQQVLRTEWGFDGFVVSDWFATRSTAASITAGLSWEMPGPGRFFGRENVALALEQGDIDEAHLDALAADMLVAAERTGVLDGRSGAEETTLDRPEDQALVRRAAAAGTVLIANNLVAGTPALPLDAASLTSVAVIGPNSRVAKISGGGSAAVKPYRKVSPLDGIAARGEGHFEVHWAKGCDIDRSLVPITAPILDGDMEVEVFAGLEFAGAPAKRSTHNAAEMMFFGSPAENVDAAAFSVRQTGTIIPSVSGEHQLALTQNGRARVLVDGEVILDATEGDYDKGDTFFGFGSAEVSAPVSLTAGQPTTLTIEYTSRDAVLLPGVKVGLKPLTRPDLVAEAEALAATCDVAIVVVGTNDDWETEGRDRDFFELPGEQPELIRRVAAVNERTIVVVNTGGPHAVDWMSETAAVLSIGFAGQELGHALADVLFGAMDPGGRMPTTIPARFEHNPAYLSYPGENSTVRYQEGLFIGHRFFDARHIEPAVPFGHGLSYASFAWGEGRVSGATTTSVDEPVVIELDITNTSERAGSDVVQVYVEPPPSMLHRPVRELKGFAKVHLDAGATSTARIELDQRAFACFDPGDQTFDTLEAVGPVPAGEAPRRTVAGWYVEPGSYTLVVARSSVDHVQRIVVDLSGEEAHIGLGA